MKKLSLPQSSLLHELRRSEHRTVVLWYGATFLVSGGTFKAERSTVASLVRRGLLAATEGIKETYKLVEINMTPEKLMNAYNQIAVRKGDEELVSFEVNAESPCCDFHQISHENCTMFYAESSSAQSSLAFCEDSVRDYIAENYRTQLARDIRETLDLGTKK